MEYFRIIETRICDWETEVKEPELSDLRSHLNGFVTEINAGHNGNRLFGIWLNPERTTAQRLATLGHELAHVELGHLDKHEFDREAAEAEAKAHAAECATKYMQGYFDKWIVGKKPAF